MRQVKSVVANHPSGFFDLAAALRQPLAVAAWPTSPRKTRVRDFRRCASGQTSSRRRCRSIITPGSRGCGYKTVSGRHGWLNRDPIQELGGLNLFDYVGNKPISLIDPLGYCDYNAYLRAQQAQQQAEENAIAAMYPDRGGITDLSPDFVAAAPFFGPVAAATDAGLGLTGSAAAGGVELRELCGNASSKCG